MTFVPATFVRQSGPIDTFTIEAAATQQQTLDLAPGARTYISRTWSGLCDTAGVTCDDSTDFAEVSLQVFLDYTSPGGAGPPEFWYVLDNTGRIALLYQVYHP